MFVKIYVPGPPLEKNKKRTSRSTAAIRDPCTHGRTIPIFLHGKEIGRADNMTKIKARGIPYLCFESEVELESIERNFRGALDGLLAEAKGVGWANVGIIPRELHLKTRKSATFPNRRNPWAKQFSISSIIASLPCLKQAPSLGRSRGRGAKEGRC